MPVQPKEATQFTKDVNAAYLKQLPFSDKRDFEDAQRGFLGTIDADGIYRADGHMTWKLKAYDFENLDQPCPDTVNPSLWRIAQINHINGLFKVTDRVYQVRNLDMGNMTIIEGDTGIVVIDTTTNAETAAIGYKLYCDHCGAKPIKAICITHSHTDHYGGILGLTTLDDVRSGKMPLYAPDGFLFEVMSENVYAGNIMSRRTYNQYGTILPIGPKGQVDAGLGKGIADAGTITIAPPTQTITEKYETHVIDGVTFEFMLTPNTEAPSEMIMYFPQFKMLLPAEVVNHTFHNMYTLRGAEVRDVRAWWKAVDEMITRYGDKIDVMCGVHHWPEWGERCLALLELTRDSYKCLHDQCLRLMNQGYTMVEVAEMFELPDALGKQWAMRGYYGTWNHSAKAVYQKYLGWFDMVPAHLHNVPPEEAAKGYVQLAGGEAAMLSKVQKAFDEGKYRWAAEIGNHLVFANPKNTDALLLLADIYEQLGYQCENGTWRCVYLMGAYELRLNAEGKSANPTVSTINPTMLDAMDDEMLFDFTAVHLNMEKAGEEVVTIQFEQTDRGTTWALRIKNGVLNFHKDKQYPSFDAKVKLTRDAFSRLILGLADVDSLIKDGTLQVDGDASRLRRFFELMDVFTMDINIVTP